MEDVLLVVNQANQLGFRCRRAWSTVWVPAMGVSIVIAVWMVYFMDNPSKYSKWDTSVSCLGDPKVWSILPTASRSIMAWTCW